MAIRTCTAPNCTTQGILRRDLCQVHYRRQNKYGSFDLPAKPTESERFWAKVKKTETCWLWMAGCTADGYGEFYSSEKKGPAKAHRWAYTDQIAAIPEGLELDHQCRNRICVNPSHLMPTTRSENSQNVVAPRTNTSGYRGVTWDKGRGWRVQARQGGRNHFGGHFADLQEAAEAAVALRNRLMTNNVADR